MNIIFFLDGLSTGGRERRSVQLLKGLCEDENNNVHLVLTRNVIEYSEIYCTRTQIHYIDRKQSFIKTCCDIYRLIRCIKPDVVVSWIAICSVYLNVIWFFFHFNYICAFVADCNRHKRTGYEYWVEKWATQLSKYVIGNSHAGIETYGIPYNKARVIYNGFDSDRLSKVSTGFKERLGLKTRFIVSMVARFQPGKDYEMYLNAAKIVLTKRTDVTFLCVGDGDTLETYKLLYDKPNILFLGRRSDIEEILNITDISILCTNPAIHNEGVSNSILESMAFGVPVIATRGGGTAEIVENDVNGFLIEPHDTQTLVKILMELFDNEGEKNKLGYGATQTVKDKFSLKVMTQSYLHLFSDI
jgi:glycosyltransferase involved in cell wall biosynthesis